MASVKLFGGACHAGLQEGHVGELHLHVRARK